MTWTAEDQRQSEQRWRAKQSPERLREITRRANLNADARRYGLTVEEMLTMRRAPCAICGSTKELNCIDHDHRTDEVRGTLCRGCNAGIGSLADSPERLRAAADYLERRR